MARKKVKISNPKDWGAPIKHSVSKIPEEIKRIILAVLFFLLAAIIALSFLEAAGSAGKLVLKVLSFFWGKTVYLAPVVCILTGLSFLKARFKRFNIPLTIAFFLILFGVSGIVAALGIRTEKAVLEIKEQAGILGYYLGLGLFNLFGFWVTQIIFVAFSITSLAIFKQLLVAEKPKEEISIEEKEIEVSEPSFIKKILTPKFKIKEIESSPKEEKPDVQAKQPFLKAKSLEGLPVTGPTNYKMPTTDLLEPDKEVPSSGDTRLNSSLIKKTLQNFDIPVEMGEINVGPTVTQYTLKPAEGIKLSKITTLSNDLSLSLAAHPIRIEAPIPGRSLVGIEIPNKVRARVRLRSLIENNDYQNPTVSLQLILGKDVSGAPVYANLARMPHLLVAGSTGTGKTIFLNSLIMSLLYKNPPQNMKMILIDPKKVEFVVYHDIPHLLAPIITDPVSACNAFRWLVSEMERRFDVLAKIKARDIGIYNEMVLKNYKPEDPEAPRPLPFVVLVVDELADLMAAKGREIEASIVRLAQMARAVGIHLVLATQRPSVEVITGLIKANITSRVAFQVASQIDSRTILDASGAEKLLGLGDLLFTSGEIGKPKRIQGAYVSEKEVKKVAEFIRDQGLELEVEESPELSEQIVSDSPTQSLEKALNASEMSVDSATGDDDSLYEEAKKIVIESKRASASLLQRRLRLGYARAARLIDMLEERGVVGPGEGAKPREVYSSENQSGFPLVTDEEVTEAVETEEKETYGEEVTQNWKKL